MQVLLGELPWDQLCERKCVLYGMSMSGCNLITGDEVRMLCADECEKLINGSMCEEWQRS